MDEKARDQYVIRAGFDTEVFWNDARQSKPDPVFQKPVSELKFSIYLSVFISSMRIIVLESDVVPSYTVTSL